MVNYNLAAEQVLIDIGNAQLDGELSLVADSQSLVLITNGSDSSRFSPRCQLICEELNQAGFSTLLFNLLTVPEEDIDLRTQRLRYRIPLLARRIVNALDWVQEHAHRHALRTGILATGTAAGAAIVAAAERPTMIHSIVCRGGWPELAGEALASVSAPTLMIVGGYDASALAANEDARRQMRAASAIECIPQASHLFEEPGTLAAMATSAAHWFTQHLHSTQAAGVCEPLLIQS